MVGFDLKKVEFNLTKVELDFIGYYDNGLDKISQR